MTPSDAQGETTSHAAPSDSVSSSLLKESASSAATSLSTLLPTWQTAPSRSITGEREASASQAVTPPATPPADLETLSKGITRVNQDGDDNGDVAMASEVEEQLAIVSDDENDTSRDQLLNQQPTFSSAQADSRPIDTAIQSASINDIPVIETPRPILPPTYNGLTPTTSTNHDLNPISSSVSSANVDNASRDTFNSISHSSAPSTSVQTERRRVLSPSPELETTEKPSEDHQPNSHLAQPASEQNFTSANQTSFRAISDASEAAFIAQFPQMLRAGITAILQTAPRNDLLILKDANAFNAHLTKKAPEVLHSMWAKAAATSIQQADQAEQPFSQDSRKRSKEAVQDFLHFARYIKDSNPNAWNRTNESLRHAFLTLDANTNKKARQSNPNVIQNPQVSHVTGSTTNPSAHSSPVIPPNNPAQGKAQTSSVMPQRQSSLGQLNAAGSGRTQALPASNPLANRMSGPQLHINSNAISASNSFSANQSRSTTLQNQATSQVPGQGPGRAARPTPEEAFFAVSNTAAKSMQTAWDAYVSIKTDIIDPLQADNRALQLKVQQQSRDCARVVSELKAVQHSLAVSRQNEIVLSENAQKLLSTVQRQTAQIQEIDKENRAFRAQPLGSEHPEVQRLRQSIEDIKKAHAIQVDALKDSVRRNNIKMGELDATKAGEIEMIRNTYMTNMKEAADKAERRTKGLELALSNLRAELNEKGSLEKGNGQQSESQTKNSEMLDDLRRQVARVQAENVQLRERIESKDASIADAEKAKLEVDQLKADLIRLTAENAKLLPRISQMSASISSAAEMNQEKDRRLSDLSRELKEVKATLEMKDKEHAENEKAYAEAVDETEKTYSARFDELKLHADALQVQLEAAKVSIEEAQIHQTELVRLKERISILEAEKTALKENTEHRKANDRKHEEALRAELGRKEKEVLQTQERERNLQQVISALQSVVEGFEKKEANWEAKLQALERKLATTDELEAALERATGERLLQQEEIERLRDKLDSLKATGQANDAGRRGRSPTVQREESMTVTSLDRRSRVASPRPDHNTQNSQRKAKPRAPSPTKAAGRAAFEQAHGGSKDVDNNGGAAIPRPVKSAKRSVSPTKRTLTDPSTTKRKRESETVKPSPLFLENFEGEDSQEVKKPRIHASTPVASTSTLTRAVQSSVTPMSRPGSVVSDTPVFDAEWTRKNLGLVTSVRPTGKGSTTKVLCRLCPIDRSNAVKEKTHLSEQARKQALDQISRDKENMIVEGAESIEEDSDLVIAHMRELHVSTIMRLKVKRQREGKA